MTPHRRHLMLAIVDDDTRVLPYMYHFDFYTRCDEMLSWLFRNRLTGKRFYDWAQEYHSHSMIGPAKEILRRMDKEAEEKAVLFGRDYGGQTVRTN